MSSHPKVKAVLLCAGAGTRLRPLTDTTPKCLLPILGRPLMDYWFDSLNEAGIEEVVVNTHWLADRVDAHLAARGDAPPRVTVLHEPELLGSAGTLAGCRDWAADADVVVSLYGDLLVTQKIGPIVEFHLTHGFPFTLTVARQDEPWRRGIATVDSDDIVTEFVEKPPNPVSDLAAAGMYAMSPGILAEIHEIVNREGLPLDLGRDVLPRLAGRMKAFHADGVIHDIGTRKAYDEAQELAARLGPPR